jgi:FkbM family methyltransferase
VTERNLIPESGFNRCVRAREGCVLYNRNDLYVGRAIERYGEYAELEAQLLRHICRSGAVVADVGANIGTHTLVMARAVGAAGFVYAYEPQRVVFQTLCANLALNSVLNVEARPAAVGAAAGHVVLPEIDYGREANFGGVELADAGAGRRARLVTLDEDLETERLDAMKIDVEGMELEVLRGADALLRRFRPLLYLENDRPERSPALVAHLLQLGYRLYWHAPPLFNPDNFYGEAENLYPGTVSINMLGLPRELPQDLPYAEVRDPEEHPLKAG